MIADTITSQDIEFNQKSHRYKVKGSKPAIYIPSVTTICGLLDKPFLVEWAAREAATEAALSVAQEESLSEEVISACINKGRSRHRQLREDGASVGTEVHGRIAAFFGGQEMNSEDEPDGASFEVEMAMEAFTEWWLKTEADGWRPINVESIVIHPSGRYVGTFDLLLQLGNENRFRLADFKTTTQSESNPSALYPEYLMQVAAYRKAIVDSPEYKVADIEDAEIVCAGKTGHLVSTVVGRENLLVYEKAFVSLLDVLPAYRHAQRFIRGENKIIKLNQ